MQEFLIGAERNASQHMCFSFLNFEQALTLERVAFQSVPIQDMLSKDNLKFTLSLDMPQQDGKGDASAVDDKITDGRRKAKKRKHMESNSSTDVVVASKHKSSDSPPSAKTRANQDVVDAESRKKRKDKKKGVKKDKAKSDGDKGATIGITEGTTDSTNLIDQETNGKPKKKKKNKKKKNPDHVHQSCGQNKALRYLALWDESQSSDSVTWKFEKCRQIWLLQNAYDESKIPDKDFDVLLKYMCTIKGRMRDAAIGT